MPKKKSAHMHLSRALVAALIGIVAVPTAMTGLFQSIDDDGINTVPVIFMRNRALNDRVRVRQLRRDYWRAVGIYNELRRLGYEGVTPPDVNDRDSINYFLDPSNFLSTIDGIDESLFGAAPEDSGELVAITEARAQYNTLPETYRDLLDGYVTSRRCPGTLRQFHVAGFYQLCNDLLDETIAATKESVLSRSAYLRGFNSLGVAPLRNLRQRLKAIQDLGKIEGAYVRPPRGPVGRNRRPRLDYSQYHQ